MECRSRRNSPLDSECFKVTAVPQRVCKTSSTKMVNNTMPTFLSERTKKMLKNKNTHHSCKTDLKLLPWFQQHQPFFLFFAGFEFVVGTAIHPPCFGHGVILSCSSFKVSVADPHLEIKHWFVAGQTQTCWPRNKTLVCSGQTQTCWSTPESKTLVCCWTNTNLLIHT